MKAQVTVVDRKTNRMLFMFKTLGLTAHQSDHMIMGRSGSLTVVRDHAAENLFILDGPRESRRRSQVQMK